MIEQSNYGDVIVFVGTKEHPTKEDDRGKILGIAEFSKRPITNTLELLRKTHPDVENSKRDYFNNNGSFKWPHGLPMLKAWRFPAKPLLTRLMKQLPYSARHTAVLLNDEDAQKILELERAEATLHSALQGFRDMNEIFNPDNPTKGPPPSTWTKDVTRDSTGPAYTYALRYGDHDLWKIGFAKDVDSRLSDINKHIPYEIYKEHWRIVYRQLWPTQDLAYRMECTILELLAPKRTHYERVICTESELWKAWGDAHARML